MTQHSPFPIPKRPTTNNKQQITNNKQQTTNNKVSAEIRILRRGKSVTDKGVRSRKIDHSNSQYTIGMRHL
ncbi:MAG: hypothetical protein F6K47_13385 [Symploca sp. SIO2E6]|nr:hypothetical protein [Symploca sp. SIO2E6]